MKLNWNSFWRGQGDKDAFCLALDVPFNAADEVIEVLLNAFFLFRH